MGHADNDVRQAHIRCEFQTAIMASLFQFLSLTW